MENKKYPIKWGYINHSYQIGDTGDYDGYWEVTNGKDSLITKEDYDDIEKDLQAVVDLLNNTYANFTFNRDIEAALEAENKWLRRELEELKKQGLAWVKASERFPGWRKPVRWRLDGIERKVCDVYYLMQAESPAHIGEYEWLDESAPSGEREDDAVAFAEWLRDNTVPDGAPKLFYKHDISRYTTAQLYNIFKQQKEK